MLRDKLLINIMARRRFLEDSVKTRSFPSKMAVYTIQLTSRIFTEKLHVKELLVQMRYALFADFSFWGQTLVNIGETLFLIWFLINQWLIVDAVLIISF